MEEKDTPRRRKLHILRFAFRGKSSVIPLLLLSPPNPLALGFGGAPVPKPPFGIRLFIRGLRRGDVRRCYVFARVQFTRFRPVRRRAGGCMFFRFAENKTPPPCNHADCKHCFRRTRLYCTMCGEFVGTERITGLICSRKLGGYVSLSIILGTVPQGHFLRRC